MGLFAPAWKGSDEEKALAQVEKKFYNKIQMKKLFQIAQEAPIAAVRRKATDAIMYQVSRLREEETWGSQLYARLGESFLRLLAERNDEAVSLHAIAALAKYPQHRDYAINALNNLNNFNSRDTVDVVSGLYNDPDLRTAILDKTNNPETIIHPAQENEELEMLRMEQGLRQRIRGTEAEERILDVLDKYPDKQELMELGKYPDRDTVEALTLVLYYYCRHHLGNDLPRTIFEIMWSFYVNPAFDNRLLAKMRLSRFNRGKDHEDRYNQYCDCIHYGYFNDLRPKYYTHTDTEGPPVTFRF